MQSQCGLSGSSTRWKTSSCCRHVDVASRPVAANRPVAVASRSGGVANRKRDDKGSKNGCIRSMIAKVEAKVYWSERWAGKDRLTSVA